MRFPGLLVLLPLLLAGCYSYNVVPAADLAPGARVRARITAAEAERQSEALGFTGRVLTGTVVAQAPGGVLLQVPSAVHSNGAGVQWLSQRVEISSEGLVEVEVRRLDRIRTAGTVAAVAAVIGYAAAEAFAAAAAPTSTGSKGGSDKFIGFSLPLPR